MNIGPDKGEKIVIRRQFLKNVTATGLALMLGTAAAVTSYAADNINVFAAASLKDALDTVNASWKADAQKEATLTYAATSALAKQIQEGAPADVFFSADTDWMKRLTDAKLITNGSAVQLLGNEIVLVAPKDSTAETKIEKGFDLSKLIGDGKLSMADIKAVPAGKYGKAALENLGAWTAVEPKVAQAENVRAALKLVATGEAAFGIVYVTDAKAEPAVKVVATFPADSHPPIIYPAGVVATSKNPDAAEFIKYLQGSKAQAIFKDKGFVLLTPAAQ